MGQFPFVPFVESREIADDVRELFDDLAATLASHERGVSGEYRPALDVFEEADHVEVIVDVCGIAPDALRVLFRAGVLLIVGEKAPDKVTPDQTFHLVEREFGRFSRAIRLAGAFDVQQARATLENGELTVVLPKLVERRGQAHRIAVSLTPPP